jgi:uncharacterized RDD family membrane protein YckC
VDWYYKTADGKVGPVNDSQVRNLAEQGKITGETMVWNERESRWRPFRDIADQVAEEQTATEPVAEEEFRAEVHWQPYTNPDIAGEDNDDDHLAMAASAAAAESYCSGCFRKFPNDELVRRGKEKFCPSCEPAQSKEGKKEKALPSLPVAGFGIRTVAKLIDGVIIAIVDLLIYVSAVMMLVWTDAIFMADVRMLVLLVVYMSFPISFIAYTTIFTGIYGATPGKLVFGLKVVNEDGTGIGYAKALGRCAAEVLSALPLALGYIIAAFDIDKRTLHDRICSTRVVLKSALK